MRIRILVAAKNLNFFAPLFCGSRAEGSLADASESLASDSVGDHRPFIDQAIFSAGVSPNSTELMSEWIQFWKMKFVYRKYQITKQPRSETGWVTLYRHVRVLLLSSWIL